MLVAIAYKLGRRGTGGSRVTQADIAAAVNAARGYLSDHPDEARYTDSPATARLTGGLRVRVEGPAGLAIDTDMPRGVGGTDSAPSPGWLLRAAHAACDASLIALRAAELGVELARLEVTIDSESDDRGILGLADEIPAGPLTSRVRVLVAAPGTPSERLEELVEWGISHCPVDEAVRRAVPVTVEVTIAPT
jgi:uncharacterized OsmC-like protein